MKQKIATIILSIVIFIVPILVIPIENQSYNLIRAILLSICGIILIINFFINIKKNKFDGKDILILGFGVIAIFSTIFSQNFMQSVKGAPTRFEGILVILTYIFIYYNAKYYFQTYKKIENIAISVYLVLLVFAIVQFYMPSSIKIDPFFGRGAHGTFLNTNSMGSFVSIVLPFFIIKYNLLIRKSIYLYQ